jgi:2-haloacid dehalogenase
MRPEPGPRVLVFDLGGVLLDWSPRYLYRKLLGSEAAIDDLLARVCPHAWNEEMDAGKPFAEGVAERVALFPGHAALIRAYAERWHEMVGGPIEGTVALLREVRAAGVPCYALSNWSAETFPPVRARYDFLNLFDGVVISGEEGVRKPDPRLYRVLFERYGLAPAEGLFVDDVEANVAAARALGLAAVRFTTPEALRGELEARGFVRPRDVRR